MENFTDINGKVYKNLEVEKFIKILIVDKLIKVRQRHELIREYFVYIKYDIVIWKQSKDMNRWHHIN